MHLNKLTGFLLKINNMKRVALIAMKKTENLYIDALKFGLTRMQQGLTFKELQHHLTDCLGWTIQDGYMNYFRLWFLTNFYNADVSIHLKHGTPASMMSSIREIQAYDDIPCVMTAEAYEMLQDFEKLQQAKKDAKNAHSLSLWAIGISIVLGLIQIIVAIYQTKSQ